MPCPCYWHMSYRPGRVWDQVVPSCAVGCTGATYLAVSITSLFGIGEGGGDAVWTFDALYIRLAENHGRYSQGRRGAGHTGVTSAFVVWRKPLAR